MNSESNPEASPMADTQQRRPEQEVQVETGETEEEQREEQLGGLENGGVTHHPSAPPDELFDIPTTIDPSYVISLMRKLLPLDRGQRNDLLELAAQSNSFQQSQNEKMEDVTLSPMRNGVSNNSYGVTETMETQNDDREQCLGPSDIDGRACCRAEHPMKSTREEVWEESGCILWDLAANKEHAEFMVQNFVLEVLLANLRTSNSARITEICLGITGNLACHEALMNLITTADGLLETLVDQIFSDDAPCLCEVCRLLTSGLQGCQCGVWAKALHAEHILSRILWITENTLNPILIERSVVLLLAIMENQQEVAPVLLPTLMNLGLPSLLVNLLVFEMGKLTTERMPERYPALDSILRALEALSVIDDYSEELCLNKKVFQMALELVKIPEKIELSSSCITAAVLIANILVDATDLVVEMSKDFLFLQSLLDLFPFTSDDFGARNALWSILAKLLRQVQGAEMSPSSLNQYVQLLVNKSDLIEDVLLDGECDASSAINEAVATSEAKSNSRTTAIKLIVNILNSWSAVKNDMSIGRNDEDPVKKNQVVNKDVLRLLDCCLKHSN